MLLPIQITSIVQAIAGKTYDSREVLGTKLRLFGRAGENSGRLYTFCKVDIAKLLP